MCKEDIDLLTLGTDNGLSEETDVITPEMEAEFANGKGDE